MKKHILNLAILAIIAIIATPMTVIAKGKVSKECTSAALKAKPGKVTHTESLTLRGRLIYEYVIRDKKGRKWELMCDAKKSKIIEVERKTSKASKAFKKRAKISEEKARKIALKRRSGKITKVEYELVNNRTTIYEIAIKSKGRETKVEVSAVTGKIVEVTVTK